MNPFIGANFTALLSSSTQVTFPPTPCMCLAPGGSAYVIADAAAIAASPSQRASGLAVSQGGPNGAISIQYVGEVAASITGVGTNSVPTYVRVSSAGLLERVSVPGASDQVVGWADTLGNVQISFFGQSSSVVGTLAGDVTGASSSNRVTSISGASSGNAVAMNAAVHMDWASGTLSVASGNLKWTGTGILNQPATNAPAFIGGITNLRSGVWLGAAALAPLYSNCSMLYDGTNLRILSPNSVIIFGSDVSLQESNVSFGATFTPLFAQDDVTSGGAAATFTIRAQGNLGAGAGGAMVVSGGRSISGTPGNVRLDLYQNRTMVELHNASATRRILALANGAAIASEVGANSGDKVIYIANCATAPTANATAGGILYGTSTSPTNVSNLNWWGGGLGLKHATFIHTYLGGISTTAAGLWFASGADAPSTANYSLLSDGGTTLTARADNELVLIAPDDILLTTPLLRFDAAQATPLISQVSTSGSASTLRFRGQTTTQAGSTGGTVIVEAGQKGSGATASQGSAQVGLYNGVTMIEAADIIDGTQQQRVVALCRGSAITATQIVAGAGDLIVYIGNTALAPANDPVSGGILYAEGGALKWRGSGGTITTLAAT